jgi:hypothetical protein
MRYHDEDEAARLNAEPWMLDLLKLNPSYLGWGPHEDYMWKEGGDWDTPQIFATWADFGPWQLDDLNECVNFYFSVNRASEDCKTCGGSGTHPDAQWVADSFYSHSSPFKKQTYRELQAEALMRGFGSDPKRVLGFGAYPDDAVLEKYGPAFRAFCEQMRERGSWSDDITEDEAAKLIEERRAKPGDTADSINARNKPGARGIDGHDAINRWILIRRRCERLGLPVECPACEGHGEVHTEPAAHVSLTLWWLHPRKGCSRGLEVTRLQQSDLPAVFALLRKAAESNAQRFSKIPPGGSHA